MIRHAVLCDMFAFLAHVDSSFADINFQAGGELMFGHDLSIAMVRSAPPSPPMWWCRAASSRASSK